MWGGPNFGSERTVESPHPVPVVTEKARDDYVLLNLWKPVAVGPGNTQTTKGTQRQSHFWISLEFSLVAKYNTRFIKKFSQLNSDIQSYRHKDFSLRQVAGLMGAELRDVTCFAWLHWKLVCLWQFDSCFRFPVAASEIFTVISSNSSFISSRRSFREIFWEVLWTLKLTQSQVGIVGLKIVNSLNRINRCIKLRKRNRFNTGDFCCIFYRFVDFLTLNTLTQLYLKKSIHVSDQYCFEKLPNN